MEHKTGIKNHSTFVKMSTLWRAVKIMTKIMITVSQWKTSDTQCCFVQLDYFCNYNRFRKVHKKFPVTPLGSLEQNFLCPAPNRQGIKR